ncbi:hypothetical protein F5878DRAFT_646766 [Lentinula raphanica]|uniref:Uncharacterized protein n=1 Tax=Lentinula raphanica TaxID=153919 RepID=A0AA38NXH6_9AGAR|nr:hypothetical protein F5878DRAFT_646766 [Lentinula raphanica]
MADMQRPAIIIPMPVPGMPDAPKFEGKDAREFLEQIEAHGSRAGITDNDKLVDFIVRYSSRSIKTDIRFIPEFDPDVEDKTWEAAKKMLLQMFSAQEEPPEVSIRDLEDSCIVWSTDEPFTKKTDVDRYQRKFFSIAAPLLKQGMLTTKLKGYYFLQGLPKKDQKYVEKHLPAENKKKANPPTVEKVIKLVHQKIDDKESILHHNWDSEEEDVDEIRNRLKSRLNKREEDTDDEGTQDRWATVRSEKNMAEKRDRLDLKGYVSVLCAEFLTWMGLYRPSVRKCPTWKYTLPNGQDLPRIPFGVTGGVVGMLRAAANSNPTNGMDRNPILSSSPASMARLACLGTMFSAWCL